MKKAMILMACLTGIASLHAQDLKTYQDSISYAVGILWGQNIKQQGLTDIDAGLIGKAIADVLAGEGEKLDIKSANEMVKTHFNKMKEAAKEKNMAAGRSFLAEKAKSPGVVTLPSGLLYEVVKEGDGAIPVADDKVSVHYQGTLIDGTVFDSSIQRGAPATFPVTGVIKGWVEALQLMKTGSKWKLYIPSDLAYGERGAGGQIGPYATLVFEVELLGIEGK